MSERHYPTMRLANRSENTSWAQAVHTKHVRALAVTCMPDVLGQFPETGASGLKRENSTPEVDALRKQIVSTLKMLGLLSPDTAWCDVRVDLIVHEARRLLQREHDWEIRLGGPNMIEMKKSLRQLIADFKGALQRPIDQREFNSRLIELFEAIDDERQGH